MEAINLPPHLRKPRLNRKEACEYLEMVHGITRAVNTLAKLAHTGGGPAIEYVGKRDPRYPRTGLDAWAERLISPPVYSTAERK